MTEEAEPRRRPRVLVVGARTGSLGHYIADHIEALGVEAHMAGIATEPLHLDVTSEGRCHSILRELCPTHVVCTVGRNDGGPVYEDEWEGVAREAMEVNFLGPMNLLRKYEEHLAGMPGTFVAISSNSAHIARSSSSAYCASKAALSMALRCAARDFTRAGIPLRVWGYEPGALAGTPMTVDVGRRLPHGTPMSRMLTNPAGMPVGAVARIVARDLLDSPEVLLGCIVRLDAGDQ